MDTIRTIPLFRSLCEREAERHARACNWRAYAANELVIDFEDDTTDVRFILSGAVRVILRISAGREMILAEMREGEHFGEIAAIDGETRSANVTALQPSRMCVMPRGVFLDILRAHEDINLCVLRELAGRVRSLNTRLSEHSFLQTRHRLYCELLRMSRPRPINPEHRAISPPPTQKDLAARIGSRREVVSREIANMKRAGVLDRTSGAIVLPDVTRLNRMISEGWEACA